MSRVALNEAAQKYVHDHYPDGVATVVDKDGKFYITIVGNKYNPGNYW